MTVCIAASRELTASPPPFAIQVARLENGSVRVEVRGELDLSTSPELGTVLRHEITAGRSVLLDLSGVTFIDSTGLNALLAALRWSRADNATLALAADLTDQVRRVVEITGLDELLPIVSE